MSNVKFVGISGSLRKDSYNTKLLNNVAALLPEEVTMEIVEIRNLPLYDGDYEEEKRPLVVTEFRKKIAEADALVFVSPEYNYSIPGGLKNAIDWASRGKDAPIIGKPVSVMSATIGLWGGARLQLAFLPVFKFLNMFPVSKHEVMVAQANQKFDDKGNLLDETTKEIIKQNLLALKSLTLQLKK
ncbi:MAG: NAD(P)H-dependent oxidoreductase [Bacteroidetes bacterium]|nr:NAD(P)H-dependent oxidoreductase [Bacteroidota bacterium]